MENSVTNPQIAVKQTGPFNFQVEIVTHEGIKFINPNIQAHPHQLNQESILNNFKTQKNNWILDIDAEIIKENNDVIIVSGANL